MSARARVAGLAAGAVLALGAGAAPARAAFTPGSEGLGDPFFPKAGNGGYEVGHYRLDLRFNPRTDRLRARTEIAATATQDLSRFDLDYLGPAVRSLKLNGERVANRRDGQELIVTPDAGIPTGTPMRIIVRTRGRPGPIRDPDGSREGWFHTRDGSVVVAEPRGSITWYPSNDYPTDKATFRISIEVPRGRKAVANGRLVDRRRIGEGWRRWTWRVDEPMATYLATVATGRFELERGREGGVPSIAAVDPRLARASRPPLRKTGEVMRMLKRLFGPYPFGQVGAIVDRASFIGYALETQTRPAYDRPPNASLITHELAHQWFGNSVSLSSWPEIWLNEGFAQWAQWRWSQRTGGETTAERFERLMMIPGSETSLWNPPPADVPGPEKLFAESVYVRGAMALEALRQQVGTETFLAILRRWAAEHAHGNATIAEFTGLAEAESGQELDALFDEWLLAPGKPSS